MALWGGGGELAPLAHECAQRHSCTHTPSLPSCNTELWPWCGLGKEGFGVEQGLCIENGSVGADPIETRPYQRPNKFSQACDTVTAVGGEIQTLHTCRPPCMTPSSHFWSVMM